MGDARSAFDPGLDIQRVEAIGHQGKPIGGREQTDQARRVTGQIDYLEAGDSLDEFLEDFPSVTRQQAVAALELAKQMLVSHANSA